MAKSNEIGNKLEASIPDIEKLVFDSELLAAQTANSLLLARVFNDGAKDINYRDLKGYSKAYAKRREKLRLQVQKKDLIVTNALHLSIQVGTTNNKPAMGFLTERSSLISEYQEKQAAIPIFQLSDDEREIVKNDVKEFVLNGIREIIKNWQ